MSNDHIPDSGQKVPEMNESKIDDFVEVLIRATVLATRIPGLEIDNLCKSGQQEIKQLIDDVIKSRVCVDCFYIDESLSYCSFHDDFLFFPEKLSCTEFKEKGW